jgi:hypothetical protein
MAADPRVAASEFILEEAIDALGHAARVLPPIFRALLSPRFEALSIRS